MLTTQIQRTAKATFATVTPPYQIDVQDWIELAMA
jgi:hypothetical protein